MWHQFIDLGRRVALGSPGLDWEDLQIMDDVESILALLSEALFITPHSLAFDGKDTSQNGPKTDEFVFLDF